MGCILLVAKIASSAHSPQRDALHQQLRQQLRQRRRDLSSQAQALAAQKLLIKLARNPLYRRASKIAFYWPSDGEISPLPLMQQALKQGKHCYFPVVDSDTLTMTFRRYRRGDRLLRNRFGIPEPLAQASALPVQALDLVLMPLVGFDTGGNRLGMGGGFYDRAFANFRHRGPLRIGLAHSLQKVPHLESASWDIPLHGICTEAHFHLL